MEVHALDALARLAADAGRTEVARDYLDAADRLAPQVAHLLDLGDRLDGNAARRRLS